MLAVRPPHAPGPGGHTLARSGAIMPYTVDFNTVSAVGLESSPVAAALAGLRANEARYFKNKYDHVFTVEPASKARTTIDWPRVADYADMARSESLASLLSAAVGAPRRTPLRAAALDLPGGAGPRRFTARGAHRRASRPIRRALARPPRRRERHARVASRSTGKERATASRLGRRTTWPHDPGGGSVSRRSVNRVSPDGARVWELGA